MASVQFGQGYLFAARYRVHALLGVGGMGAVYQATDLKLGRRRALKVMLPHMVQNAALRERFEREACASARVDSQFVVDVLDGGIDEATQLPFLVMELLDGEDLAKRLHRIGRLDPEEVIAYLYQTALALRRSHSAQIIHRDLKPENLYLVQLEDGTPRIKVLDFGIAKFLEDSGLCTTGTIGTPTYMAPEQLDESGTVSPRTDIYALGMVAYTLLVGQCYWHDEASGGNVFALAALVRGGPRDTASLRALRKGVHLPPAFDRWFARATAVLPSCRFDTPMAAVEELARTLDLELPKPIADSGRSNAAAETGAGPRIADMASICTVLSTRPRDGRRLRTWSVRAGTALLLCVALWSAGGGNRQREGSPVAANSIHSAAEPSPGRGEKAFDEASFKASTVVDAVARPKIAVDEDAKAHSRPRSATARPRSTFSTSPLATSERAAPGRYAAAVESLYTRD